MSGMQLPAKAALAAAVAVAGGGDPAALFGELVTKYPASPRLAAYQARAGSNGPGVLIGSAVGGGGDVNGDLIDDVVFGAPDSGMNGLAYVVFGAKGDPVERKVADLVLGKGGFALAGPGPDTQTGASVTLVPSVNADELAEVFIGAPGHGVNNEGRAYLVYGGKCEG